MCDIEYGRENLDEEECLMCMRCCIDFDKIE